jgi:DNA-binding MarR family transcriptional regulator
MDYDTGYPLFKSEIHMVDFIGRHPNLNISELAYEIGMTKSAASQVIAKLNRKKLIFKKRKRKEVYPYLTEEGQRAFDGHKRYHETQNQYSVFKNTTKYTPEIKRLIADFLSEYIDDLPKS